MPRQNISSGSPFEKPIGFSRAVRIGSIVAVSGTAPVAPDGNTAAPGDVYGQTRRCLEIIETAVKNAGGDTKDIIRTRIFMQDASQWKEAGRAHGEFFGDIRPACTFVGGCRFIREDWLVEIEADAVIQD